MARVRSIDRHQKVSIQKFKGLYVKIKEGKLREIDRETERESKR